jgi:hypothetical protein
LLLCQFQIASRLNLNGYTHKSLLK